MRDRFVDIETDDDDWDPEEPDDLDDDETDVAPCPTCGVDIFEDAERCPSCGEYVVQRRNAWHGKPWWWVVLGLAGIMAVLWLMMP
jgi:hypothetical protein